MKRRGISAILASILASAAVLSGCGGTDGSKEGGSQTSSAEASAGTERKETEDPVTLQVMITSLNDSADGPFLESVMEEYMNLHPNVTLEPIPVAMNDLYTKLLTLATSDSLPDIFTMQDAYMSNAVEMDMVQDLTPLLGEEWLAGTMEVAIEGCKVDDMLVFMPWQNNTGAMVYRKDLFEEKNLEIPETWDEFLEVAEALTEDLDGDGEIDRYGCVFPGTRNDSAESRFQSLCMTFGAYPVREENGTISSDIGSEEFLEALQFYTDVAVSGLMPEGFVEIGYPEAYTMLAADQACMFFGASNVLGAVYNANPEMKGKFGSFPMPHAEGKEPKTTFGTLGMSISKNCEHPEVAADFLKFLTNKENSIEWSKVTGRLPCRTEALEELIEEDPVYQGFADSTPFAELLPTYAGTAEIRDIMGEAYQSIVAEGVSVADAAETAEQKTQEVLEKYK